MNPYVIRYCLMHIPIASSILEQVFRSTLYLGVLGTDKQKKEERKHLSGELMQARTKITRKREPIFSRIKEGNLAKSKINASRYFLGKAKIFAWEESMTQSFIFSLFFWGRLLSFDHGPCPAVPIILCSNVVGRTHSSFGHCSWLSGYSNLNQSTHTYLVQYIHASYE